MKNNNDSYLYDEDFYETLLELAKHESENKSNAMIFSIYKRFRYDLFTRKQAEEDENEHRGNPDRE